MSISHPTGLGEPEPEGKLSLFQPPKIGVHLDHEKSQESDMPVEAALTVKHEPKKKSVSEKRIRTTIDLTSEALVILQQVQQDYRLKTGRVLPMWKALSMVITEYTKRK